MAIYDFSDFFNAFWNSYLSSNFVRATTWRKKLHYLHLMRVFFAKVYFHILYIK